MSKDLSPDDGKALVNLCRAGRLYAVEEWIAAGKSIRTPPQIKKTPLHVALDLGFHSLVELLIRDEDRLEVKNEALANAVERKRLDFVELLVSYGADIRSVPLSDVLLTWEPQLIAFFLDRGADVITDAPFAVAFREKIRTALRPYVEYKKAHPELASDLPEQADRALRHFCNEGDLKWISLLLWAGANPRYRPHDPAERHPAPGSVGSPALVHEAIRRGQAVVVCISRREPLPERPGEADRIAEDGLE